MSNNLDAIKRALKNRAPGRSGGRSDINWYRPPSGTEEVRLRLLPAWKGSNFPLKPVMYHYEIPAGEGDDKPGKTKCLRLYDQDCPVCDVITEFEDRLDKGARQAATIVAYANVLVRRDPTQKLNANEPQVIAFSAGVVKWLDEANEEAPINEALAGMEDGMDLILKRKKKNGGFDIRTSFKSTPVTTVDEEAQSILSKLVNLDEVFKNPSDDDVIAIKEAAERLREHYENVVLMSKKQVGRHTESDDAESEDEAQPSMPQAKIPPAKKLAPKVEVVEEESTEEVEEEAEAEVEEERPAKKTLLKPTPKVEKKEEKPVNKLAATLKAGATKRPSGAPKCFSDADVYEEGSEKCEPCPFEFSCQQVIAAAVGTEAEEPQPEAKPISKFGGKLGKK